MMLDMEAFIEDEKLRMTLLKEIDIGSLGKILMEDSCARMAYISSNDHLVIHPYLHMNSNVFMGLNDENIAHY